MDTPRPPAPPPHLPLARLGLPTAPTEAVAAVRAGLPVAAFEALARALHVPEARLAQVVGVSATTLGRRKRAGALAPDEGDRVWRVAALFDRAAQVFGDEEDAAAWFADPNLALGDVAPLALADTAPGVRAIDDLLGRIEYGVYS
jgi:putative toxin-antitoxin system antitoxin component (TIGR02293 family)